MVCSYMYIFNFKVCIKRRKDNQQVKNLFVSQENKKKKL